MLLQPGPHDSKDTQGLPFKAYEPTLEIRDRKSRAVFIEASYAVETGEAERIAVDWTARGGEGGGSRKYNFPHSCRIPSDGQIRIQYYHIYRLSELL